MNRVSLIYTPFKCGSCTLFEMITHNNISDGSWISNAKDPYKSEHFVLKCHSQSAPIIESLDYFNQISGSNIYPDTIFFIVRHPDLIYKSAFFQDISNYGYLYRMGTSDEVLNCPIENIVKFYYHFDWGTFEYLNLTIALENIKLYTGVDIMNETFNFDKLYHIFHTDKHKLCILSIDILNNTDKIKEIFRELNYDEEIINNIGIHEGNYGNQKWYAEIYNSFKSIVIDKPLSESDLKVIEKFSLKK